MFSIAKDTTAGILGTHSFHAYLPELGPCHFYIEFIKLQTLTASKHFGSQITLLALFSALLPAYNILHFSLFLSLSSLSCEVLWGVLLIFSTLPTAWTMDSLPFLISTLC